MLKAAFLIVAALAGACSKNSPDAHAAPGGNMKAGSAPASPAQPAGAAAVEDKTPPPGVDLGPLGDFERKVFFRVVNKEPSVCGKAHSLLQSAKTDPSCRKSLYGVKYVARLVLAGYTDSEVSERLQKRFRSTQRKTIDVADAPMKGNPAGRITLVEFVDYECPHCKRVQPVMRQALEEFRNEVRLYFKHYPLGSHTNARLAAEGAVAAHKQGKFWPFNDGVWANAESLSPAKLEQIAKESGLDVEKWRKDLESTEVRQRVTKDRADGETLGLTSTPTIYINGREFTDSRDLESLRDWINEELGR